MDGRFPIAARLALVVHDCMGTVVCASLLSCALAQPAYGYIDPSVMTYTIQAVAGVAVALSAIAGVAFRRSRRTLMRFFGIDENARKQTESAVHRVDGEGQSILNDWEVVDSADGKEKPKASQHQKSPRRLKWPSRLWRAILASTLLVGTIALVAPAEMVTSSSASLAFTLADVWQPLLLNACAMAAAFSLAMSAYWGKAFDVIFAIIVALGLCLYLQAMVFNQSLPAADGTPLYLEDHMAIAIGSTAVFAAIVLAALVLSLAKPVLCRSVATLVCTALIVVQGAAVASLWTNPANTSQTPAETSSTSTSAIGDAVITKEGLFEVSPDHNVVIFVLDTFDVIDLDELLYTDPDILDEMTGFTYFSNSTGFCAPTRYGMPFLLTGAWPHAAETWDAFLTRRYSSTSFTDDIVGQGYSLYVFTDTPGRGGLEHLNGLAANIHTIDQERVLTNSTFNMTGAVQMIYRMALYRDMPWFFKEPFWFYTDEVNRAAYDVDVFEEEVEVSSRVGGSTPYIMDDAAFYKQLCNRRLSIYDDGAKKGSLHIIHLDGLHTPYTIDGNAQRTTYETTRYEQAKGLLRIVDEYLRQMKSLGVYDDASIIITADHGMWPWETTIEQSEWDGDMAGGPIMLVKPAGTAEQSSQPCQVSEARTGHLDYPATVIDAVGGDSTKYGTTVFEANDPNRVRTYLWPTHNGTIDLIIYEYEIDGEVSNWYNWKRTGTEWPFNQPATSTL